MSPPVPRIKFPKSIVMIVMRLVPFVFILGGLYLSFFAKGGAGAFGFLEDGEVYIVGAISQAIGFFLLYVFEILDKIRKISSKLDRIERTIKLRGLDKPHIVISSTSPDSIMEGMQVYTCRSEGEGAPLINLCGGKAVGNKLTMEVYGSESDDET